MTSPVGRFTPSPEIPKDAKPEDDELLRRAAAAARNKVVLLDPARAPLKSRCSVCKKKGYTILMGCACKLLVCAKHRFSHECTVDHSLLARTEDEDNSQTASRKKTKVVSSEHVGPSGDTAF